MELVKLAQIRQEQAGAKYVLPNGENQANYRDCGLDIVEELADAWNIANLWEQRMIAASVRSDDVTLYLWGLRSRLKTCVDYVAAIRAGLPGEFKRDLIEVERVCRWEDEE
jgi:hypothetical protein